MNALIEHFLQNNRKEVLKDSIIHCHLKNVHSVMLLNSPGKMIRMFIAEPGNELWMNEPGTIVDNQSVAFHSHHCNLTLKCVYGEFTNRKLTEGNQEYIPSFKFQSHIKTGKGSFEKIGQKRIGFTLDETIKENQSIFLRAKDIHTIVTPKDAWAAWLVLEGKEDKNYDSTCYSYKDLTKEKFTGLYQKMTITKLNHLLKNIAIL